MTEFPSFTCAVTQPHEEKFLHDRCGAPQSLTLSLDSSSYGCGNGDGNGEGLDGSGPTVSSKKNSGSPRSSATARSTCTRNTHFKSVVRRIVAVEMG